jgi:hypothetical protein
MRTTSTALSFLTDVVYYMFGTEQKKNPTLFRERGSIVVQKYIDLFPTWVQLDILRTVNPLDSEHGHNFVKIKSIDEQRCKVQG